MAYNDYGLPSYKSSTMLNDSANPIFLAYNATDPVTSSSLITLQPPDYNLAVKKQLADTSSVAATLDVASLNNESTRPVVVSAIAKPSDVEI
jgi:hypothetical protein